MKVIIKITLLFVLLTFSVGANAGYAIFAARDLVMEKRLKQDSIMAEQGFVDKQLRCAIAYSRKGDYRVTRHFLEKAIEAGNDTATCYLAEMEYFGLGQQANKQKAYQLIRQAQEHGNRLSNMLLGIMYYYGDVIPRNTEKAYTYFTWVPDNSLYHKLKCYYLYKCYCYGRGVEKDLQKAEVMLQKAICESEWWWSDECSRHDEEKKAAILLKLLNSENENN